MTPDIIEQHDPHWQIVGEKLTGNRRKIYIFLMEHPNEEFGMREIGRELGLSSVSLAKYHLDILEEMMLVTKSRQGKFKIARIIQLSEINEVQTTIQHALPREIFFITYISAIFLASGMLFLIKQYVILFSVLLLSMIVNFIIAWGRFYIFLRQRKP